MGIRGFGPRPRPAPKATCAGCGRPVALLRSERCVYCGAATGDRVAPPVAAVAGGAATPVPVSKLPPELLIALEPRPSPVTTRGMWLRRILALGGAGILTALVMGPCMRS